MTQERSVQQIRTETEQTRASLTATVEQMRTALAETASDIRQRVSPRGMKSELSHYLRNRLEQWMQSAVDAAKRNPMQAVAVVAGVSYPLLRLVRGIPAPIWMVGAGLFLANSKTGQAVTHDAAEAAANVSNSVADHAGKLANQAAEAALAATSFGSKIAARAGQAAAAGSERLQSAVVAGSEAVQDGTTSIGAAAADQVAELAGHGGQAVRSAAASAGHMASDLASSSREALDRTMDAGSEAASALRDTASQLNERGAKTFSQTLEQNPLLVAGIGLFVGGFLASALPRTEMEKNMAGGASRAVRREADAAAARSVHAVNEAVNAGYEGAAQQACKEGLTAEGLRGAAENLGERLRHVAETAVTTAFEPDPNDKPDQQQRTIQGKSDHHG